jgi:hypothetical protein
VCVYLRPTRNQLLSTRKKETFITIVIANNPPPNVIVLSATALFVCAPFIRERASGGREKQ